MLKKALFACATVLLGAVVAQAQTPQGDPAKGRAMFMGAGGSGLCMLCHGTQAQGGFGPGLAGGRGLTFEQFKRAVTQPWSNMPRYNINDEGLAHLYAFLKSLPPAPEPTTWNVGPAEANAPNGQKLAIQFGCAQCHGPEMGHPRRDMGGKAKEFDFAHFKKVIYEKGPTQMGLFNPERLNESIAKEIFTYLQQAGYRALLFAAMSPATTDGGNLTYTITLDNKGEKGMGLAAEDVLVSLVVPEGFTVVSGTGGSFLGAKPGVETVTNPGQLGPFRALNPKPNVIMGKVTMAQWKVKSVPAGEKVSVTITLKGTGTPNFSGSNVTWGKPAIKRPANVTHIDNRTAAVGDIIWGPSMEFSMPPAAKPAS